MASDVPAFLQVETPVSAKFKGAFCEATIKSIKKLVKCKVLYKDSSGSSIVTDEFIRGELKLNATVQVKMENGEFKDATIQKMNDHSLYTVVFDDGDEKTLRRTNVCVMGQKHFLEHENLDNLPLTDPENFLSPVVYHPTDKRRKRRRSQPTLEEDDSDSDGIKPSKKMNDSDKKYLGKVVCVEQGERKKSWFPALGNKLAYKGSSKGLKHFGNHPDNQIYVQSFKDGKKMLVRKDDVKEFNKEKDPVIAILKGETKADPILKTAIDKALAYHDMGELPKGWNILDTIDEKDDTSDEETIQPVLPQLSEEDKSFQQTIYDFLSKKGQPVSKPAVVNNQGINLRKMFESVNEYGGFEEVSNPQWRAIYKQLGLRNIHTTTAFNMKNVYKKYLLLYEEHSKSLAKSSPARGKSKSRRSKELEKDIDKSSTISESDSEPDRRRTTRSTRSSYEKPLSIELIEKRRRTTLPAVGSPMTDDKSTCSSKDLTIEQEDMDTKSETEDVDVVNSPESSITSEDLEAQQQMSANKNIASKYKIGAKISVRYGSGKNQRLYTAKILEIDKEENDEVVYYIHYNGWNRRYNEWIKDERIVGLSTNTPNKKKHVAPPTPITKIAKDPPPRFKVKFESDMLSNSSTNSKSADEPSPTPKTEKSIPTSQKPPSPIKSPGTFSSEILYTSEQVPPLPVKPSYSKAAPKHRDTLVLPDIKPSPIKPRTTRNSMQDTFLLNAIEESIGHTNPAPAPTPVQQDVNVKPETTNQNRRRSSRQPNQAPVKQENENKEEHCKHEKDTNITNKKEEVKPVSTDCLTNVGLTEINLSKTSIESLNRKESSKNDSVKKWIEDSSKILSKPETGSVESETVKTDNEKTQDVSIDEFQNPESPKSMKKGRKSKLKKTNKKNSKSNDSDTESEIKEEITENVVTLEEQTNNNVISEKDRTSETAQLLTDFCDIVESAHKLTKTTDSTDNIPISTNRDAKPEHVAETSLKEECSSPAKESHIEKKKKKNKRKRCHSAKDEDFVKSPKKEKKSPPALEYNVDFVSDLQTVLMNKEANERINIMQSRLNAMRELYCKLRTEVASIDRRRKRKLRKQ